MQESTLVSEVQCDLEFKIIKGEYNAGDKLPPIREMMNIYSVGMNTASKVVSQLNEEGITVKRRGVGYFVKPYVRAQLIKKHEKLIIKKMKDCINYANDIGTDINDILAKALESEEV